MNKRVTLSLPDKLYRRAEELARLTDRAIGDVLTETIEIGLPPIDPDLPPLAGLDALDDDAVLAQADSAWVSEADRRFSDLLQRQQAGELTELDRAELQALLSAYQVALLRKARALNEAVRRGLREPLAP